MTQPLLEVENLSCRFSGLIAVDAVSFAIEVGSITGLIGPNGAGKTTCFNMITGRLSPFAGSVRFDGVDIIGKHPEEICANGLVRTFQVARPLSDMTVLENVVVGALCWTDRVKAARDFAFTVLEKVGLDSKSETKAKFLTLPERKMLELSRALATKPRMLLLDEVMAGLRPTEADRIVGVLRTLNAEGLTLVLVEHVMRIVMSLTKHVIVLNYGKKIFEGAPNAAVDDDQVIESYLGRRRNV